MLNIVAVFSLLLYGCEQKTIRITNSSREIVDSITIDLNLKRIALLKNVAPEFESLVIYSSDSFDISHDVLLRIIVYKKDSVISSYNHFNDLGGIANLMIYEIKDSLQIVKLPSK